MTDTRQARIAAAQDERREYGRRRARQDIESMLRLSQLDPQTPEQVGYTEVMQLAADAIGRERVSEASGWDVLRTFRDAYNAEASAMGIPTTGQHSQDMAMCQAAGAFAVARMFLTAAPAERETGGGE